MQQHSPQAQAAPPRRQRGSIVMYLVIGLVAFGVLAMAGVTRFGSTVAGVLSPNCSTSARFMAESGLRYAMARLRACADSACITAAVADMNGRTISVDAAKGLDFKLAVNYDASNGTAAVTSTGSACTKITGVSTGMSASVYLPKMSGGSGDIDFGKLSDDFSTTTASASNSPITVDAGNKLVFLGVIGDQNNFGAIWYSGNNTFCSSGSCSMAYGLRAYFESQWDPNSVADGIVFGIMSALTNTLKSVGGDPYKSMGEVMGWGGPGPEALGYNGIKPPKIGLELDTWRNNDDNYPPTHMGTSYKVYNTDSRADKNYVNTNDNNRNSDHLSFVFWGGTTVATFGQGNSKKTSTYDDNRHAETFADTSAGSGTNSEPKNYGDIDGTGTGRWGYYYKSGDGTWLRDGTKYLMRFELTRLPNYPNAAGNYPYLLKAWVRTGAQAIAYNNVNENYTLAPPDLARAIFLSQTMHDNLAKVIVGFTEATGDSTQRVTVSGLKVSFKQAQEIPAMPADYAAYFSMAEGAGTTLSDGRGNTATRTNGATWYTGTSCARCPAISFNGTTGVVHSASSPSTAPGASGTIGAWYYMSSSGVANAGLVHKGDSSTDTDESYSLQLTATNRIGLVIRNSGTQTLLVETGITADSTWHHVAATWGTNELLIYIDGELKARTANTNHYTARASAGGLNIGSQGYAAGVPSNPFNGRISRVAIYNRALTAVEIAAMAVAP